MKKSTGPLFLLFLLSLTIWAACNKSSSSPSRATLITQSVWRYDTSGIDLNKDGIVDIGDTTVTVCEKQYTYLFNKDSTGVLTAGAVKCDPSDPQTTNFTWSLTNNQTVLTASVNPLLSGGVNILSLDQNKFVVYKDTTLLGTSFRYLISLKH
jgi:hypothetical protein